MEANKGQTTNEHTATVMTFLSKPLPDTINALKATLKQTETHHTEILIARITAQKELAIKRNQYLHPKDPSLTDIDRRIQLDANTSDYQAHHDLLTGLEAALKLRIDIIQTLLVK